MTSAASLVIVTICRNNPVDFAATLLSVSHQDTAPDRHIVIDGSDEPHRETINRLASRHGAEYLWAPPQGIYQAMAQGLALCRDTDWVWFVNATDTLASRVAVASVVESLHGQSRSHSSPVWCIGQTAVVTPRAPHLLAFPATPDAFRKALQSGRVGLPHPSVVTRAHALREERSFITPLNIAEDYRIALALLSRGNLPEILNVPLSIYDQGGVTGRRRVPNAWAKMLNRIKHQPVAWSLLEPFRLIDAGWRALLRGLWWLTGSTLIFQGLGWATTADLVEKDAHFCDQPEAHWPGCCHAWLKRESQRLV